MGKGKATKRKGMRRAYLKSYSAAYQNVGKQANTQVLAEYSARCGATEIDRLSSTKVLQHLKKVGDYYTVRIIDGKYKKLDLFFGSSIFFFEEDNILNIYRRSCTYSTRLSAMEAWQGGRILWIDEFSG